MPSDCLIIEKHAASWATLENRDKSFGYTYPIHTPLLADGEAWPPVQAHIDQVVLSQRKFEVAPCVSLEVVPIWIIQFKRFRAMISFIEDLQEDGGVRPSTGYVAAEAFNSDSINNSVKLLREKKIIAKGNVIKFDSGEEDAVKFLATIGDLLVEEHPSIAGFSR
uniref:Phage replication protein n=1 Tax=Steinernema glaseri TaxID=37863 RepID=A0A1I8AJE8_9BILA